MVLHGYDRAVGTEALNRELLFLRRAVYGIGGGVGRLIYMCSFMLQEGQCVRSASFPRPVPFPVEVDEATGSTFFGEPRNPLLFADVEAELAREIEALLVRQSGQATKGSVTYGAWQHIPTTYFKTKNDKVVLLEWQEKQINAVEQAGYPVTVEAFEARHSMYLSMLEEFVPAIETGASRF